MMQVKRRAPQRRPISAARRGTASVEMALITPVVLLFALAAGDFGRVAHAHLALGSATKAGAEYAGTHAVSTYTRSAWEQNIGNVVKDDLASLLGFDEGNLQISISTTTDDDGLLLTTVESTYLFNTVVPWPQLPQQVFLKQRANYRRIR